jgi:hypothetical protein
MPLVEGLINRAHVRVGFRGRWHLDPQAADAPQRVGRFGNEPALLPMNQPTFRQRTQHSAYAPQVDLINPNAVVPKRRSNCSMVRVLL